MKKPLFQKETRVWRTYKGGRMLDAYLGKESCVDTAYPEDWISSFVEAKNKNYIKGEGITAVIADGVEMPITEAVSPEDFGEGRADSGVLIKLLDAAERLGIQVHPTPDFSRANFGTDYGKTECWHILGAREGSDAAIYIGFKEGITREKWEALFKAQDIEGMLASLHRFEVKPSDTVLVRAGTPHAIGAGCFLLEIQEPTDYTMRVEKITVAGDALTPHQIHYGVGEEKLLDCFIYDGLSEEQARERFFLKPRRAEDSTTLVDYTDTPCFALSKLDVGDSIEREHFLTLVVTDAGELTVGAETYTVRRADKLFVPANSGKIVMKSAAAIACLPPK